MAGAFQRHRLAGHHALGAIGLPRADATAAGCRTDRGTPAGRGPAISATTAYEPRTRRCTSRTAVKTSLGRAAACRASRFSSSCASTLSSTSESLSVLMWRWSRRNSSCLQRLRVGQVAVVHEHDAERRVDVERLRLFLAVGVAGGRIAHLPEADVARQRAHVAGAEHVAHHAAWPCA